MGSAWKQVGLTLGAPRRPVTWDIRFTEKSLGFDTGLPMRHQICRARIFHYWHNLCLEKYIDPIIRGEYALYRIDHEGHFAVAGIKRTENGTWELDEIRGARNEEVSEEVRRHFIRWLFRPDHLQA